MKAAPFAYARPASLAEALELLATAGAGARPLAGGQSLAPMLNMRLLRPELVVDLNRIPDMAGVTAIGEGTAIGAMTRYAEIERDPIVSERLPLLKEAIGWIGDRQVRNRGTLGGSLAQADPTGEMALVCLALDARIVVHGGGAARTVAVDDFLEGPYQTVLEPHELIVEVRFPHGVSAYAFGEVGRKHNDFAIASVAALGAPRGDGRWSEVRIAVNGLDERPVLATTSAALLEGTRLTDAEIDAAVAAALAVADPADDVRASADYRAVVAADLLRGVLRRMRDEWEQPDA